MKIKNSEEDKYSVVDENTGEVVYRLKDGETWRTITEKERKRNKYYSPPIKINKNKGFAKCMLDKLEVLVKELKNNSSAFLALNVLVLHICPYDNLIKYDKEKIKYRLKDLASDMGISRQQASTHIKKLKELNIVAEVETADGIFYAINPEYYCRNNEIPERVLKAFEKKENK